MIVRKLVLLILFSGLHACTTAPKTETFSETELKQHLLKACEAGKDYTRVKGSLWAKIKSKKDELQFPATIKVENHQMVMEVTNLVGGREALIKIDGELFEVLSDSRPTLNQKGKGSWNQIPVNWAFKAFLGQPPCVDELAAAKINKERSKDGVIAVSLGGEVWLYELESNGGSEHIVRLTRESQDRIKKLEIFFERFDAANGTPLSFRAVSDEGELKIRWKDRVLN